MSTFRPSQLLHINLYGPNKIARVGGKYAFIVMGDFSQFTKVLVLSNKYDATAKLYMKIRNKKGYYHQD